MNNIETGRERQNLVLCESQFSEEDRCKNILAVFSSWQNFCGFFSQVCYFLLFAHRLRLVCHWIGVAIRLQRHPTSLRTVPRLTVHAGGVLAHRVVILIDKKVQLLWRTRVDEPLLGPLLLVVRANPGAAPNVVVEGLVPVVDLLFLVERI